MALSLIQVAIDTMHTWSVKINNAITQTDANTDGITNLDGEMDAAEGRLDALDTAVTGRVSVNEADITAAEARLDDLDTAVTGRVSVNEADISTLQTDVLDIENGTHIFDKLQLNTAGGQAHSEGQLSYDAVSKTVLADTGYNGTRVNVGQEMQVRFYNNTGVTIPNGTVINGGGVEPTTNTIYGVPANAASPATSSVILGVATMDVLDGTVGVATAYGEVRGFDTSAFSTGGVLYASTTVAGGFQSTWPVYPANVIVIGTVVKSHATEGIIFVDSQNFTRRQGSRSYTFSQASIGAGTYFAAGFYEAPTSSVTLSDSNLTQTFGSATVPYAAHAFIVAGGAGTVDAGTVSLVVSGQSIDEQGNQAAVVDEVLVADITTLSLNQYVETPTKFVGTVTFKLVPTGATTFSLPVNYGYAKYDDAANQDFTITGFEVVGLGGAPDAAFDMVILHHTITGWTYHASAFDPGGTAIATWSVDNTGYSGTISGQQFAWKRTLMSYFVEGATDEGIVIKIIPTANNSIVTMDIHIQAVGESIS